MVLCPISRRNVLTFEIACHGAVSGTSSGSSVVDINSSPPGVTHPFIVVQNLM